MKLTAWYITLYALGSNLCSLVTKQLLKSNTVTLWLHQFPRKLSWFSAKEYVGDGTIKKAYPRKHG